jgi:hypothetical protein
MGLRSRGRVRKMRPYETPLSAEIRRFMGIHALTEDAFARLVRQHGTWEVRKCSRANVCRWLDGMMPSLPAFIAIMAIIGVLDEDGAAIFKSYLMPPPDQIQVSPSTAAKPRL